MEFYSYCTKIIGSLLFFHLDWNLLAWINIALSIESNLTFIYVFEYTLNQKRHDISDIYIKHFYRLYNERVCCQNFKGEIKCVLISILSLTKLNERGKESEIIWNFQVKNKLPHFAKDVIRSKNQKVIKGWWIINILNCNKTLIKIWLEWVLDKNFVRK